MIFQSKEEMLCLLHVYCGFLDHKFCQPERLLVITKYGQSTYEKMLLAYESHEQHKILEWVLTYFNLNCKSEIDRGVLKANIIELCKADGKICRFETSFLNFLDFYFEKS